MSEYNRHKWAMEWMHGGGRDPNGRSLDDEIRIGKEDWLKSQQVTQDERIGFDSGQLVQPGPEGVRQGYRGEDEITKLSKEYQKITGSETSLSNIKSRVRRNVITEDLIDKYKKRGPYGSGFRGKEIEAVTNPKFYKTVLSELNKVKKQRNKNVFFDYDDVIRTGKWYKNLRTRLGNLNSVDTDTIVKKVLSEEFPGSYYGKNAMRDFRREKVVKAFVNYLDVNGELDGNEKRLKELKIFRGTGKKLYRNINETFQEWANGDFEVEGIDRKKLKVDQIKQIKNWSPQYSSSLSVAKEKSLKFLNDLNTHNPNLSAKEVRQRFFKRFPDVTDGSFNARITHLTQLKNAGAYDTGGGGTKTFEWIVPDKKRSPWLKELLGLKFQGNYSSFINRGDKLLARGLTEEANRLYAAAEKYFGSNGIFTKYEGQGEHPFSRVFGSGPIGNELKINSLVRGDLNMFKRLNFDKPVVGLLTEYNKNTTTLARRDEIKFQIENRKKLMNYLTESSTQKGIVDPVKFNYGPKKMTVSANVVDIDKVKNFNVEDYVRRGESYLDVFQKQGAKLGLVDTKTGLITKKEVNVNKMLIASGFDISGCLSQGGRVGFDLGGGANKCISKVLQNEQKLAINTGNLGKYTKFGKLARGVGIFLGGWDIPIELGFALPYLLAGDMQGAKRATSYGWLLGWGGKKLDEIDPEENPEAYKYFKHVQDVNDWMDAFNQQKNAESEMGKLSEDWVNYYKEHGDKSGYTDRLVNKYHEAIDKQDEIAKNYQGYRTEEGEDDLRALDVGREKGKEYLRETVKKGYEKGADILSWFPSLKVGADILGMDTRNVAPFKPDEITTLEQQIKQKGEPYAGRWYKSGVMAGADALGDSDLYDDWYDAFYGRDPREAYSDLPLDQASQLATLEKKEWAEDPRTVQPSAIEDWIWNLREGYLADGGIASLLKK